jgi:hypothetical protein
LIRRLLLVIIGVIEGGIWGTLWEMKGLNLERLVEGLSSDTTRFVLGHSTIPRRAFYLKLGHWFRRRLFRTKRRLVGARFKLSVSL